VAGRKTVIRLSRASRPAVLEHARAAYPHECCGALLGLRRGGEKLVEEVLAISNSGEEQTRRNRFLITPEDVLRAELHARERGLELLGYYHSHPDHPALPSAYDLEQAWPFYSYLIVPVSRGHPGEPLSWVLAEDRSQFFPESFMQGD
jgi:proteasome lid subunit RPN8/RPN11